MKPFAAYAFIACLLTGAALAGAAQPSSRALSTQTASRPASPPPPTATQSTTARGGSNQANRSTAEVPVHLLAVGIIILGVWLFLICSRPQRLSLVRAPGRPNRLEIPHFVLVFLVSMLPGTVLYIYYHEYLKKTISPPANVLFDVVMRVTIIVVCLLVAKRTFVFGLRNGLGLNLRHPVRDVIWSVLAVLALLPVVWTLDWASSRVMQKMGLEIVRHPAFDYLRDLGWSGKVATMFGVVILAPLAEELLFRGILQSMLRAYRVAAWPAVGISSALFVWMHMGVPHDVVPLVPLAIVLGYSYERCGRLVPSILIHALFNAVNVAIFLMGLWS